MAVITESWSMPANLNGFSSQTIVPSSTAVAADASISSSTSTPSSTIPTPPSTSTTPAASSPSTVDAVQTSSMASTIPAAVPTSPVAVAPPVPTSQALTSVVTSIVPPPSISSSRASITVTSDSTGLSSGGVNGGAMPTTTSRVVLTWAQGGSSDNVDTSTKALLTTIADLPVTSSTPSSTPSPLVIIDTSTSTSTTSRSSTSTSNSTRSRLTSSSNSMSKSLTPQAGGLAVTTSKNVQNKTTAAGLLGVTSSGSGLLTSVPSTTSGATASSPLVQGTTSTTQDTVPSTYVSGTITLTGSAAVAAALAADTTSSSLGTTTASTGGTQMSSIAIVGIVAGILIFMIFVYVVWYQWRKRRVAKMVTEEDDGSDENPRTYREKHVDDYGNPLHSGFDFSDEPISGRRSRRSRRDRRSRVEDPFDDRQDPGTTWYQDPFDEGHQDRYFEDGATHRNGPQSIEQRFEEDIDYDDLQDIEENLKTGKTGAISHRQAPDSPPAMPPLSMNHSQGGSLQRPPISHSQAESFNYGDLYGDYGDPSRPGTHHDPNVFADADGAETMYDPATSSLLPWLGDKPNTPAPPVPTIPANLARPGPSKDPWQAQGRSHTRKGVNDFTPIKEEIYPGQIMQQQISRKGKERAPPVAAMANTPDVGRTGWDGVVPGFR